jgi:hypothetical protein
MKVRSLIAAAVFVLLPVVARAQVLTFEGIAPYPNGSNVTIGGFYDGGVSGIGTTGTNYGIDFSSNALLICLNTLSEDCSNTSHGGADAASADGGLYFLSGAQTFMGSSTGFITGFSFLYTAVNNGGSISVYSGPDGTGTLLATQSLPTTPLDGCDPGYSAGFCPFESFGISFAGTAQSVSFAGVANQIVFDDVTFGSVTPGGAPQSSVTPEPATMTLMATGLVGLAGVTRRRRRKTA